MRNETVRSETTPSHDVVLFSTADWDHPFWTNKQHVAAQLAERGFRVLYVESLGLRRPTVSGRDLTRIGRRLRRAWQSVRQVRENLWVASPLAIPWHDSAMVRRLNDRLLSAWLTRTCRRLGFERPIAWTYNPLAGKLIESLDPSLIVYHAVDDLSAAPHMARATIELAERELAQAADLVLTTSESLQARLIGHNPHATHYLPNVADFDHFSQARSDGLLPADLAAIPAPRIGFVGALSSYKVDFNLIATVARARPDWHWVLIGQVGEGQPETSIAALSLPNVHLLGPQPYAELPNYLRGFDVAAIPCPANDYTRAMFPMKFFEYLAAGRQVVVSNVPALISFGDVCQRVDSPEEFIEVVARMLSASPRVNEAGVQVAARYTWQWRLDQMLLLVDRAWRERQVASHGTSSPTGCAPPRAKAG